jgi:hypothetical protein
MVPPNSDLDNEAGGVNSGGFVAQKRAILPAFSLDSVGGRRLDWRGLSGRKETGGDDDEG